MSKRIYLAQPYSDSDPAIQEERFQAGKVAAAKLMKRGLIVFAPIVHSHPVAEVDLSIDTVENWRMQDTSFIEFWATELWIYTLPGWEESAGVTDEIETAGRLGIPITYWDGEDD